jgi:flavin-dependent thymidylate synthase
MMTMKVELIDYTGAGSTDPLYAARMLVYAKNTRLLGEMKFEDMRQVSESNLEEELLAIARTIRSSWEFVDFVFLISGVTRAFTHQLVRTRTASYAQQAMRVVDMSDFDVVEPDRVKADTIAHGRWVDAMLAISQFYKQSVGRGIPVEDARAALPTNVTTRIMTKMNLRTLADLVAKRVKSMRAQGEYSAVVAEMELRVLEKMPWAQSFLRPERTSTPALDELLRYALAGRAPVEVPRINDALKELDMLKGTWG